MDLRKYDAAERELEAQRLAAEEALKPFDLASGPLLRITLLRVVDEDYIVLVTLHHIVSDGWSTGGIFPGVGGTLRGLRTRTTRAVAGVTYSVC